MHVIFVPVFLCFFYPRCQRAILNVDLLKQSYFILCYLKGVFIIDKKNIASVEG